MNTDIHVGDTGLEILADCQQDISAATNMTFLVRKPSGATTTWAATKATLDGETRLVRYLTVTGDLNEPGVYTIHPHLTLGAWTGVGKVGSFEVKALFS